MYGFSASYHTESKVCAAVSALTINAVNSIEAFTKVKLSCDFKESGGYLKVIAQEIKDGGFDSDCDLLFKSLVLGLSAIKSEYSKNIKLVEIRDED